VKNQLIINIFYIVIFGALSFVYSKNAIHMFQQQRYELRRYNKWLFNLYNLHFSIALIYVVIEIILMIIFKNKFIGTFISLLVTILYTIYVIKLEASKTYIKDLVLTSRVKRQIVAYTLILIYVLYRFIKLDNIFIVGILAIYSPYLLIYLMAWITWPMEEIIKKHYENDARAKLKTLDNVIKIGITGSYGKTSTKNIVNDIICNNYFTHITPASYNTPMGITRTIRADLKPIHEVFVCEMGADKIGDIEYLMKFVKPSFGVVTSIGPQHLATFKSQNNIIREKMKEIEMLPSNGVGFINLDNEFIQKYRIKNSCKVVSVGIDNKNADYVASNIKYSKDGSLFTVKIGKKNYKFETVLLGKHNITNILIGIAIAIELNIDIEDIVKNVKGVKQVEHRLEVKKINGYTFIDDAFNSNPVGSKMALDVLSLMPSKRVIVTPGMIDLGKKQDEINYEFGKYMYERTDYVILVGEKQTKEIYNGLKDANFDMNKVVIYKDVRDALKYVYSKFTSKDVILLENDLPDAFNV